MKDSNQIVSITRCIYIPKFDSSKDEYIDVSPYKPYERNSIQYECRCRAGSVLTNNTTFKQHIKSKTHQDFIQNYSKYFKEVDESQEKIKQLTIDKEMLQRKVNKLQQKINHLLQCLEDENDIYQDCE